MPGWIGCSNCFRASSVNLADALPSRALSKFTIAAMSASTTTAASIGSHCLFLCIIEFFLLRTIAPPKTRQAPASDAVTILAWNKVITFRRYDADPAINLLQAPLKYKNECTIPKCVLLNANKNSVVDYSTLTARISQQSLSINKKRDHSIAGPLKKSTAANGVYAQK